MEVSGVLGWEARVDGVGMIQIAVVTCSDRALEDTSEDRAGAAMRQSLTELGFTVVPPVVVALDREQIAASIVGSIRAGARIVFTTGGTGVLERDVTVEATRPLLAVELPGLMEEVRRVGSEKTRLALLSRGAAGIMRLPGAEPALVVNAPGSRGGVRDTLAVVGPLLDHLVALLDTDDHDLSKPDSGR